MPEFLNKIINEKMRESLEKFLINFERVHCREIVIIEDAVKAIDMYMHLVGFTQPDSLIEAHETKIEHYLTYGYVQDIEQNYYLALQYDMIEGAMLSMYKVHEMENKLDLIPEAYRVMYLENRGILAERFAEHKANKAKQEEERKSMLKEQDEEIANHELISNLKEEDEVGTADSTNDINID